MFPLTRFIFTYSHSQGFEDSRIQGIQRN